MTPWLRLFPKEWRQRYGSEVDWLLSTSARSRFRDVSDLLVTAVVIWTDHLLDTLHQRRGIMKLLRSGAVALSIVGVLVVAWTATALQDGLTELPTHWWSTLAAVPLVAGIVAGAIACWPRHRPITRG